MAKKLVYLSNLAFLILYFILAVNNRLVNDDFCSLVSLHRFGIIKATEVLYSGYCTRWISVLFVQIVLSFQPFTNVLLTLSVVTLLFILFSFAYLLKQILILVFQYNPGKFMLLNLSLFTVNALFYSTFDTGTTWFWLSSLPTYLWSFIFFTFGCGLILSNKNYNPLKLVLLSASFFYIGGTSETFAAVILIFLCLTGGFLFLSKSSIIDWKIYLVRIAFACFFCLSSLIVLYVGHGNIVRRSALGEISLMHAFLLNIETTGWIGLHWISSVMPSICLFSLPFLFAGKFFALKSHPALIHNSKVLSKIVYAVLIYGILIFIFNYPITYLLCGLSPARALFPLSFLTWALAARVFFMVGYNTSIKENAAKTCLIIVLGLCLLLNCYNIVQQYRITCQYSRQYDTLMKDLSTKKDISTAVEVSPLPPSGMLPSLLISPDSTSGNNRFLKQWLGLKANIIEVK